MRQGLVKNLLIIHGRLLEIMLQRPVVVLHDLGQACFEVLGIEHLAQPNTAP